MGRDELEAMVDALSVSDVVAIDIEDHTLHSFQGTDIVMADIVMADIVMADIVMAHIVMASNPGVHDSRK